MSSARTAVSGAVLDCRAPREDELSLLRAAAAVQAGAYRSARNSAMRVRPQRVG